jgi:hypothetical protein
MLQRFGVHEDSISEDDADNKNGDASNNDPNNADKSDDSGSDSKFDGVICGWDLEFTFQRLAILGTVLNGGKVGGSAKLSNTEDGKKDVPFFYATNDDLYDCVGGFAIPGTGRIEERGIQDNSLIQTLQICCNIFPLTYYNLIILRRLWIELIFIQLFVQY